MLQQLHLAQSVFFFLVCPWPQSMIFLCKKMDDAQTQIFGLVRNALAVFYIYNILGVCLSGRPPWGLGVRVSTPFINVFQKKKDFFNADSVEDTEVANTYSSKFFNTLEISGMPSHKLSFKIGTPMMLMCNLDPSVGLCNGTHLIVRRFTLRVVETEIITSKGVSNVAFISCIKFISDNNDLPFTFVRKQFPLWLAYVMTINKFKGQTLFHVDLHLVDDVFSHD
jgi:hypothetical protein